MRFLFKKARRRCCEDPDFTVTHTKIFHFAKKKKMSDEIVTPSVERARAQIKEILNEPADKQASFFKHRYVLRLDYDSFFKVDSYLTMFNEQCKNDDKKDTLSKAGAAALLQKLDQVRTQLELAADLKAFDLDYDGRMCFLEFMCLEFKSMILAEYNERHGTSLDKLGGDAIMEEMIAPPPHVDENLEKMMKEFDEANISIKKEKKDLEEIISKGGIPAMSAKTKLENLNKQGHPELNALDSRISTAKKKVAKKLNEEFEKKNSEHDAKIKAENAARKTIAPKKAE
jgi:hypothetical protein